jgi:hypothetical protein
VEELVELEVEELVELEVEPQVELVVDPQVPVEVDGLMVSSVQVFPLVSLPEQPQSLSTAITTVFAFFPPAARILLVT